MEQVEKGHSVNELLKCLVRFLFSSCFCSLEKKKNLSVPAEYWVLQYAIKNIQKKACGTSLNSMQPAELFNIKNSSTKNVPKPAVIQQPASD